MKFFKRLTAIILCAAMALPFGGCSLNKNEYITITVYDSSSDYSGTAMGWFADIIREKFGVKLVFNKSSDRAFPAYVAQGYLGDIILLNSRDDYYTVYDAGLLLDWDEYNFLSDFGANLKENYSAALERNRGMNSDGKIHGICGNVATDSDSHSSFLDVFYIRWDLYRELGYPEIDTLESFCDVIEDMVELEKRRNPDSKVLGMLAYSSFDDKMVDMVSAAAGMYGYEPFGFGLYNPVTDSYEPCIDRDGIYVRCLRFYNKLFRMGLINTDAYNATYNDAVSGYNEGKAVFGLYEYIVSAYNTDENLNNGRIMLPIVAKDFSTICTKSSEAGTDCFFTVAANAEYPDLCISIIDWLFSEEGTLTLKYGPRGTTWDYDSDGRPYITQKGFEFMDNPDNKLDTYDVVSYKDGSSHISLPTLTGNRFDFMNWESTISSDWYKERYALEDEVRKDWCDHTGASDLNSYIENNGYTVIETSDFIVDTIDMDLTIHVNELKSDICVHTWDAVFAPTEEDFELALDAMIAACNARESYPAIMEFYENELNRYRASLGR